MRSSGERDAVDDVLEDEHDAATLEAPADASKNRNPVLHGSQWVRAQASYQGLVPVPPLISRSLWVRLARQIAATLRNRTGSVMLLRDVVRLASAEMRLAGGTREDVEAVLRLAMSEHPELSRLDRVSVVTRRRASDDLLARMLDWLD